MSAPATIVWFRHDLRLEDHHALRSAVDRGGPVIPVFLWAPEEEGSWAPGAASRWWLHQSLASLDASLRRLGSRLVLRRGPTMTTLVELAQTTSATAVLWHRRHEPAVRARDERLVSALHSRGLKAECFPASLLFEPGQILTRQGRPYQMYTPFWNSCGTAEAPPRPIPAPTHLLSPPIWPASDSLASLQLEPRIDWAAGLRAHWEPGAAGATRRVDHFLATALPGYAHQRDRPDLEGTSTLSPHLHFGEISPRTIWHRIHALAPTPGTQSYLKELGWREFAHHLLHHFPHTPEKPLRSRFATFPWRVDGAALRAWQRGQTGYPIVDAGMRQLWTTGWMHNRVRMIVASFLVKHLLLSWQDGARWFWDTLVDADLANNTLGWQWSAGCGADAAPYFRIFNPALQSVKFDPEGGYIHRWLPELATLSAPQVHQPWRTPFAQLQAAGIRLGRDYPHPIIDHVRARERALAALATVRDGMP